MLPPSQQASFPLFVVVGCHLLLGCCCNHRNLAPITEAPLLPAVLFLLTAALPQLTAVLPLVITALFGLAVG